MPRVDGRATAFCDAQVARPQFSPNGRGGCPGAIAVDPKRIPYGSNIRVYQRGTNNLLYQGRACDYCGAAVRAHDYLVDVWFSSNGECNNWGVKQVSIEW